MRKLRGGKRNWQLDNPDGILASLENTLVPERGSATPTFTRSTTATVEDFEGRIIEVKSGEARFEGARRVENLLTDSENAEGWITNNTIVNGNIVTGTGTSAYIKKNLSLVVGESIVLTLSFKPGNSPDSTRVIFFTGIDRIEINKTTGLITVNNTGLTATSSMQGGIINVIVIGTLIANVTSMQLWVGGYNGIDQTGYYIEFVKAQLENVTGQTNQNPSEYVSNGVSILAENDVVINGTFSQDSNWNKDATVTISGGKANFNACNTLLGIGQQCIVAGRWYVVEYEVTDYTSGDVMFVLEGGVASGEIVSAVGVYKKLVQATLTGNIYIGKATTAFTGSIDNVSVKEELFHGAGVDGVKYFDYENGNTVVDNVVIEGRGAQIPEADLKGVLIEGQSTNLFLNSDTPANQSITVINATVYTIKVTGTGSITLSGGGAGTVDETGPLTFTTSSTSVTCTITGTLETVQLEEGSFATSYIPTEASAVTRNADVLSYPSAGIIDSTKGALSCELNTLWTDTTSDNQYPRIFDDGGNNYAFFSNAYSNGNLTMGDSSVEKNTGIKLTNKNSKVGVNWGNSTIDGFIDGVKGTEEVFDNNFNFNSTLTIGNRASGDRPLNGTIKNMKIWKNKLPNNLMIGETTL